MRIIGGSLKRRRIAGPPAGSTTRPLPDRVREAVFNLLRGHWEGAAVFDAFAGTGSFGLEAASRGASRVVMVERDRRVARVLQENVRSLGLGDVCETVTADALGPLALARCPRPVDIVFLDPPYDLVRDAAGWERVRDQLGRLVDLLSDTGFAIVRTPWPFYHREQGPPPGTRAPGRPPEAVELDLRDERAEEELDAFEAELRRASGRPDELRIDADLTLPNAEGPETHVYRHTAVHLYMRRRDADTAPSVPEPDAGPP